MTVLGVKRIGDNRQGDVNNNQDGTTDLVFRVRTSLPADGKAIVMAAVDPLGFLVNPATAMSIPPAWAVYGPPWVSQDEMAAMAATLDGQDVSTCVVVRRQCRQTDDANTWEVTCTFSSSSPVTLPYKVRFGTQRVKLAVDKDVDGKLLRNSYDDPFANTLELDSAILTLTVERNVGSYSYLNAADWVGDAGDGQAATPVNETTWWDFPAGTVRLVEHSAELVNDIDVPQPYFRESWGFEINLSGWHYKPLDCGFRGLNISGDDQDPFFGTTGQPRSGPTLLDGHGFELDDPNSPGVPQGTPVFRDFEVYPRLDFSVLGLDQPAQLVGG